MRTLYKSDGSAEFRALTKAVVGEEGAVLAVVYAPDRPDADGDFAEAPVITEMAHSYLKGGAALDIEHDGVKLTKAQAYVAESFIVGQGDQRFENWLDYDGQPVGDLTGAWATKIKLETPELRKAYADGDFDGVSLFGPAVVEQVDPLTAPERVAARLGKSKSLMDKEQFQAMLAAFAEQNANLIKALAPGGAAPVAPALSDAQKAELAKAAAFTEPVPAFTGDVNSADDLTAYEGALRAYGLRKAAAEGTLTPEMVAEMRKAVTAVQPTDADAGIEAQDSAEVKELKRKLFKAQSGSNAPGAKPRDVDLQKSEYEMGEELGRELQALIDGTPTSLRVVAKS